MAHVTTGYDLEVLLSEDLLQKLIGAAYDEGLIPKLISDGSSYGLTLARPSRVAIPTTTKANGVDEAVIGVTIPSAEITVVMFDQDLRLRLEEETTVTLAVTVEPKDNGVAGPLPSGEQPSVAVINYRNFLWPERFVSRLKAQAKDRLMGLVDVGDVDFDVAFEAVFTLIKNGVDGSLTKEVRIEALDIPNILKDATVARLRASGGFQSAIGIYFNLPLSGAPPRGNIRLAQTFLPIARSFAVGSPSATVTYIGNHEWVKNELYRRRDITEDLEWKPISFGATILGGVIVFAYRGDASPPWPLSDFPVLFQATFHPFVEDGHLKLNIIVPDPEINVGLVNKALGVFGSILVATFLGPILGLGSGLITPLAVGSLVALDVAENLGERKAGELLRTKAVGIESIFSAMPAKYQHFALTNVDILNEFNDVIVRPEEIRITGSTTVTAPSSLVLPTISAITLEPPTELTQSVALEEVITPKINLRDGTLSLPKPITLSAKLGGVQGFDNIQTYAKFRLHGSGGNEHNSWSNWGRKGEKRDWSTPSHRASTAEYLATGDLTLTDMLPVGQYTWSVATGVNQYWRGGAAVEGRPADGPVGTNNFSFEIAPIPFDTSVLPPHSPFNLEPLIDFINGGFGPYGLAAASWHPNDWGIKFEFEITVTNKTSQPTLLETGFLERKPKDLRSLAVVGYVELDSLNLTVGDKFTWRVRAVDNRPTDNRGTGWVDGGSVTVEYFPPQPTIEELKKLLYMALLAKQLSKHGIPLVIDDGGPKELSSLLDQANKMDPTSMWNELTRLDELLKSAGFGGL